MVRLVETDAVVPDGETLDRERRHGLAFVHERAVGSVSYDEDIDDAPLSAAVLDRVDGVDDRLEDREEALLAREADVPQAARQVEVHRTISLTTVVVPGRSLGS